MLEIGEICTELFAGGDAPKNTSKEKTETNTVPIYSNGIDNKGLYGYTDIAKVLKECVTISARGTIGYTEIRTEPFVPIVRLIVAVPDKNKVNLRYLKYLLDTINIYKNGNSIPQLTIPMIKTEKVPVPTLDIQEQLVKEMESQEEMIESNKKLIEIMEKKIEEVLSEI